jgi:hypothetical protein
MPRRKTPLVSSANSPLVRDATPTYLERMRPSLVSALAALGLLALATPALAIKGGTTSTDPNGLRKHVVQIKGPSGTQCTGTVIARRLILTAAHCFLAGRGDYRIRALDQNFRFKFANGTQVALHPEFDVSALGTNAPLNDVALLRSDRDFPDWLEPVPVAARIANGGDFVDVTVAGFGMSRDHVVSTAGRLREMRFAMLDQVAGSSKLLFLLDRRERGGKARAGICRGDSGGPVFQRTASGLVLVGVVSAVIAGKDRDCGDVTAVTAVSIYRNFLESMARAAGTKIRFL